MWSTNTYSNRWFTTHTPLCLGQPVLFTPHLTPSWSSARSRKAQGSSVVLDTPKVEERSWAQGPRIAHEHIDCSPAGASQRRLRSLPSCPPSTVARRTPRSRRASPAPCCVQGHIHYSALLLIEHVRTCGMLPPHASEAPALGMRPLPSCAAWDLSRSAPC